MLEAEAEIVIMELVGQLELVVVELVVTQQQLLEQIILAEAEVALIPMGLEALE